MRLITKLSLRVRSIFHWETADRDLGDELRFHLERQIAQNITAGMSADEARRAALREFGGLDQIREECSDMRNVDWLHDLLQDVRYGVRVLGKSPGFTAVAVLTLALGIGANTAIFSLIDSALLRGLPVSDPASLLLLQWSARGQGKHLSWSGYGDCITLNEPTQASDCTFSEPMFREIRDKANVFSTIAAIAMGDRLDVSGNGQASMVDGPSFVSGGYFETLGIRPATGRLIAPTDDAPNSSPVVVLSYGYWKGNFGGSPSAIGRTLLLNKVPFTIIGVAEQRFDSLSPGNPIQFWLPLASMSRLAVPWDNRDADPNNWWLEMVGRLKPGITREYAQSVVTTMFRNEALHGAKPVFQPKDSPSVSLVPAQQGFTGDTPDISKPIYVLMLSVGVVLLIACANVAGLLLARATGRHKEIALRFALGARRGRVARQFLTESVLLSVAGGAFGLLFAKWAATGIAALVASNQEGPSTLNPALDLRVLAFTAAVAIFTGILFGLAPALRGMRVDLTSALKEGASASGTPSSGGMRWFTAANALVIAQVALTMIVLVAAGLLVRTLQNLKSVDPGFDTRNLLLFHLDPTLIGYKRSEIDGFYKDLQTRLAAIPGVRSVSYSWLPLLGGGLWTTDFHMPNTPKDQLADADMMPTGPGFFEAMRIPLRLGRQFSSTDFAQAERVAAVLEQEQQRVAEGIKGSASAALQQNKSSAADLPPTPAIVNEAFIRKYLPNTNPLGSHFGDHPADQSDAVGTPGWEIVGVVANAKYNDLRREVAPTIYIPMSGRSVSFALRTAAKPENFVPLVRSIVAQMDSNLPVFQIRTETQQIEQRLFAQRLVARLSSFFALIALALACIGLYGLLSYEVSRRTRDIGIRMALGADASDVVRLVMRQGVILAAVGACVGIAAALGVTRFLEALLYNTRATDPVTFVGVAALLAVVAALASYIPARRATRVDPLVALRYE